MSYLEKIFASSEEAEDGAIQFEQFVRTTVADYIQQRFTTPLAAMRCLLMNSALAIFPQTFIALTLIFGASLFVFVNE